MSCHGCPYANPNGCILFGGDLDLGCEEIQLEIEELLSIPEDELEDLNIDFIESLDDGDEETFLLEETPLCVNGQKEFLWTEMSHYRDREHAFLEMP